MEFCRCMAFILGHGQRNSPMQRHTNNVGGVEFPAFHTAKIISRYIIWKRQARNEKKEK